MLESTEVTGLSEQVGPAGASARRDFAGLELPRPRQVAPSSRLAPNRPGISHFGNGASIRNLADVQLEACTRQQRKKSEKLEVRRDRLRLPINAGLAITH